MTHRIAERVQETTTSIGGGALVLAGPTTRMRSFSGAGFADGDTFLGLIEHATAAEWEEALCTWHSGGSITRVTPRKSSTGSVVAFSAGSKTISLVELAPGDLQRVESGTSTDALPTDGIIVIDKDVGGAHAVVLPSLSLLVPTQEFLIIDGKGDAETNNITITDVDGAGINGISSIVMVSNYERQRVLFDGAKLLLI